MAADRSILHVDMDAFYASVEQLDAPHLRGLPVLVGGNGSRGVVAAASYESRVFGCRSALPMSVAKRMCPQAIVVRPRFTRYREISEQIFEIFHTYTPLVQPLSIDEAFLDVTDSIRLKGAPEDIARRLKRQIRDATGLAASVGAAPNKFLAKLASDLEKPDGLTIIRATEVERILSPLSISRIWGIGPKTAERLEGLGLRTIGDIRKTPLDVLQRRVGGEADRYHQLAFGLDDRPVVPDREAKSIGHEQTFGENLTDRNEVADVLLEQVEQVGRRLRRNKLVAQHVTVKIRFGDFQTITRRCTLAAPTDATGTLWTAAREQFDRWASTAFAPVRLIGMSSSGLAAVTSLQLDLFPDAGTEKQKKLDKALDQITAKFGTASIHRARVGMKDEEDASEKPEKSPRRARWEI